MLINHQEICTSDGRRDILQLDIHSHPVTCIWIEPKVSAEEAERLIRNYEDVCRPILRRDAIKRGVLAAKQQANAQ